MVIEVGETKTDPVLCTSTEQLTLMVDGSTPPASSSFTIDSAAREITVSESDITRAGTYTIKVISELT